MEKETQISMKNLNDKQSSTFRITITAFIAVFVVLFVVWLIIPYIYDSITAKDVETKARTITLEQVIIAYAPETKSIIFLDRHTGKVEFSLSDSVSLAVFALKSGEIVADYNSKVMSKTKVTP